MQLIRNISLVKRVVFGQAILGGMIAVLGFVAVSLLANKVEAQRAQWIIASLAVAGIALGGLMTWLIVVSVKESVESTVQCVVRIAGGDLETKIESPGKDEISWLRAELNGMRKKLRAMVIEVRETAQSLNSATSEIASGNNDLSNRTEMQAQALQSTNSLVQQLAESVRKNAHNTHEARAVVAQSSSVAERGAQTMREVVSTMGEINSSSARITEIIGVIDGIAFQTNILALNAAVEAARAGEHGRGFAVVASEVRNLAQRSSVAAREIKALIGNSTERVDAGCKLVDSAGGTMQEILSSVLRVSGLISDIADAGEMQSGDIDQVTHDVTQVEGMTQQNAAMVEQLAATAHSLNDQAARLTSAMGSFQVNA